MVLPMPASKDAPSPTAIRASTRSCGSFTTSLPPESMAKILLLIFNADEELAGAVALSKRPTVVGLVAGERRLRSPFLHKLIELAVGRREVRVPMAVVLSRLVDRNTRRPQLCDRRVKISD